MRRPLGAARRRLAAAPGEGRLLLVLRHAKSSWDDPDLDNFDRPLAPRGRKAAKRMGRYLGDTGLVPDAVLCSAALRARQTWARIAKQLCQAPEPKYLKSLYMAPPSRQLDCLRRLDDAIVTALLIGHNPGQQALVLRLCGDGPGLERAREKFPTGALAAIRLGPGRWAELAFGDGTLVDLLYPRDLD